MLQKPHAHLCFKAVTSLTLHICEFFNMFTDYGGQSAKVTSVTSSQGAWYDKQMPDLTLRSLPWGQQQSCQTSFLCNTLTAHPGDLWPPRPGIFALWNIITSSSACLHYNNFLNPLLASATVSNPLFFFFFLISGFTVAFVHFLLLIFFRSVFPTAASKPGVLAQLINQHEGKCQNNELTGFSHYLQASFQDMFTDLQIHKFPCEKLASLSLFFFFPWHWDYNKFYHNLCDTFSLSSFLNTVQVSPNLSGKHM